MSKLKEEILNKLKDKDYLYREYIELNRSSNDIAKDLEIDSRTVCKFLKKLNIKKDKKLMIEQRKNKIEKSNLQKYGVKTTLLCEKVKKKRKKTMLEKYGVEHALQAKELAEKKNQTNLEKYGVKHVLQSKKFREKQKNTNLEKYGVEHHMLSEDVKNKLKKTNKEKYGVKCVLKLKEIQEKINETNLEKYGNRRPLQSKKIQEKVKQTNLKKYGVENPRQSKEIEEKIKKTNIEKYGVENPAQSKEIYNKVKQTNLEKYGVENPKQSEEIKEKIKKTNLEKYGVEEVLCSSIIRNKIKQTNLEKYGVENPRKAEEIKKKIHETKKKNNSYKKSETEENIYDILKDCYDTERQFRSEMYPHSCDFYIPELKLYIEFNGIWTHGDEPYNGHNLPESWIEKSENSNFYKNAILVYTKSDPQKRKNAKKKDLNYLEIWYSDYDKGLDWLLFLLQNQGLPLKYTEEALTAEFSKIIKEPGNFESFPHHNKIIEHFQKHFYHKERELWNNPRIREKIVKNRMKYKEKEKEDLSIKEILLGFKISGINRGYSFFSPLWVKSFIEKYKVKRIYDPCAGWGHRLLGATQSTNNVFYIGNDNCEKTYRGLNNIKNYFEIKNCILYNNNAEEFIPNEEIDAVFTCPPYFDTEIYLDEKTSTSKYPKYKDWLNLWWRKVVSNCLSKKPKYFAFVINKKYKEDMARICEEEGLVLRDIIRIGKNTYSHFQPDKDIDRREYLLVFKIKK